MFDVNLVHSC